MISQAGMPVPASSFGERRLSGRSGGGRRTRRWGSAAPGCAIAPRTRTGSGSAPTGAPRGLGVPVLEVMRPSSDHHGSWRSAAGLPGRRRLLAVTLFAQVGKGEVTCRLIGLIDDRLHLQPQTLG